MPLSCAFIGTFVLAGLRLCVHCLDLEYGYPIVESEPPDDDRHGGGRDENSGAHRETGRVSVSLRRKNIRHLYGGSTRDDAPRQAAPDRTRRPSVETRAGDASHERLQLSTN